MSTLSHPLQHISGKDHDRHLRRSQSTGGRTIINPHSPDGIDSLAEEEEELAKLVKRLDKAFTATGMEISAEKTKLMTNNTSGINIEIGRSLRQSQASSTWAQL